MAKVSEQVLERVQEKNAGSIKERAAETFEVERKESVPIAGHGKMNIELKASIELDDARIFDLNGKGLTIAMVTSN